MLRALSTRRPWSGYERLDEDPFLVPVVDGELRRSKSVSAKLFGSSKKSTRDIFCVEKLCGSSSKKLNNVNESKKKASNGRHPLFSLFGKKKSTAKPEFARYLQYVKEGGVWDIGKNMPVLYYK